jgi:hypothetical protein
MLGAIAVADCLMQDDEHAHHFRASAQRYLGRSCGGVVAHCAHTRHGRLSRSIAARQH